MKILVTGGTGFVGKNLARRLADEGHDVTVTASGGESPEPRVRAIYTGFGPRILDVIRSCRFEAVFHQAANNDTLSKDREQMFRSNVYDPLDLYLAAFEGGCQRFIFASSTAVYGDQPAPYVEGETRVAPLNPYGESKAALEYASLRFAEEYGVTMIGLRYCNVYGPGEERKGRRMSMIGQMIRTIKSGGVVSLFRDGSQRRDWCYIDDVVSANIKALATDRTDIYNVGSGTATSFNEIARIIAGCFYPMPLNMSNHVRFIDHPFPEAYQSHTECNIEKARRNLSYEPCFDVRNGILQYLSHLSGSGACDPASSTRCSHERSGSCRQPGR